MKPPAVQELETYRKRYKRLVRLSKEYKGELNGEGQKLLERAIQATEEEMIWLFQMAARQSENSKQKS